MSKEVVKRVILVEIKKLSREKRKKISLFGLPCFDYTVHNEYQDNQNNLNEQQVEECPIETTNRFNHIKRF